MSVTVRVRSAAQRNLRDAARWYETQQSSLGSEFVEEVRGTFHRIAENPYQFQEIYRRTRRALIERFPFGVFFLLSGETAVVIAIMHTSRDPERWQIRT